MRVTRRLYTSNTGLLAYYTDAVPAGPKRKDIVNRDLCKSALDIVAPNLPKPGTCDVIDISPGLCNWSLAVNNLLQPRKHVLVESNPDKYRGAIDPLLSQQYSSYIAQDNLNSVLQDYTIGNFGKSIGQEGSQAENLEWNGKIQTTPNQNLILSANLSGRLGKSRIYNGPFSKLFLYQYFRSLHVGNVPYNIHRHGLVQLLAWVPEEDKGSVSPRSVGARAKLAVKLEAAFNIREIASSFLYDGMTSFHRRWYPLDVENMKSVATRQVVEGLTIPADRLQAPPEKPSSAYPPIWDSFESFKNLEYKPRLIEELLALDEELRRIAPKWYHQRHMAKDRPYYTRELDSHMHEKRQYSALIRRLRVASSHYQKTKKMINAQREQIKHLIQVATEDYGSDYYCDQVLKVDAVLQSLYRQSDAFFKDDRIIVDKTLDDYRAIDLPETMIPWNSRRFEPLLTKRSDFSPRGSMTLFEFTPKPEFVEAFDSSEKLICFEYVVYSVCSGKMRSVAKLLQSILGGGVDEFTALIPDLLNPAKGGWYDLEKLHARALSVDLIMQISLAFYDWPFRPTVSKLLEVSTPSGR